MYVHGPLNVTSPTLSPLSDNFKLSEHDFKPGDELALNHVDPLGRYKALDRGLFFKEQ